MNRIGDNSLMARRIRTAPPKSGLYHAREARRMSRSELVRLSGVSKQQLSRLENGLIRLRLDHLKPFAGPLGYTPEQILLWGRYPGTGGSHIESSDVLREEAAHDEPLGPAPGQVPELDTRAGLGGGGLPAREAAQGRPPRRPAKDRRMAVSCEFRARATAYLAEPAPRHRHHRRQHGADHHLRRTRNRRHQPQDADAGRALRHPRHFQLHRHQAPAGAAILATDRGSRSFPTIPIIRAKRPRSASSKIVGKVLCCLKLF